MQSERFTFEPLTVLSAWLVYKKMWGLMHFKTENMPCISKFYFDSVHYVYVPKSAITCTVHEHCGHVKKRSPIT